MDSTTWRAYLACVVSFYAIVGLDLVTAQTVAARNLTATIGIAVALVNLVTFSGWELYRQSGVGQ